MSYDLYFLPPSAKRIDPTSLHEYFAERPHYTIQEQHAVYQNDDTGVYFSFDLAPKSEDRGEQVITYDATFELNYFRPHVFGLEAEPEVAAFVRAFDVGIEDPQISGMADGPYSREGFLQGWNKGNEFAYETSIAKHGRSSVHYSLPGETLERYWRWNYGRAALQESFGQSAFVPRIMFLIHRKCLASAIAWTDAMPIALPKVDIYIIVRDELFPRSVDQLDIDYATLAEVESLVAQYPLQDGPLPFRLLRYVKMVDIYYWVRNLRGGKRKPEIVDTDQILNAEIADRIAARPSSAWPRLPWPTDRFRKAGPK